MRLEGEVIEVSSNGDGITVSVQAKAGRADWKPIERQVLRIDDTIPNRRAFYIGRKVRIEIKPL